jgi:hypothetical protein
MKQLMEITIKEKRIQNDQLNHERQCKFSSISKIKPFFSFSFEVFQSENDTLKQLVIRDGHDKQIQRISNGYSNQNNRFIPVNEHEVKKNIKLRFEYF